MLASWIPVVFGLVTPFFFTSSNITIRYLNEEDYGIEFTSNQLSNNPIVIINIIGLIVGAVIWTAPHPLQVFHPDLFLIGGIGAAIFQIALHFCFLALTTGPQGPASAIMVLSTIVLALDEAIRHAKVPSQIEFISLACGFVGAVLMAAPNVVEKLAMCIFRCLKCIFCVICIRCCCRKKKISPIERNFMDQD